MHLRNVIRLLGQALVAVVPVEYQSSTVTSDEAKGKYTYTPDEQEWKFFDPTDLWPIRLVSHGNYL